MSEIAIPIPRPKKQPLKVPILSAETTNPICLKRMERNTIKDSIVKDVINPFKLKK